MRARSFTHVGLTVSDFNTAVRFYCEIFGCPLVGVADTPPERVRRLFRRRRTGAAMQDRLDPRARRRRARDLRVRAESAAGAPFRGTAIGLTHFSFNVRPTCRSGMTVCRRKGVEIVSPPGTIAARALVLLRPRLRRQPDRADGPRLHVLRARLARRRWADGCSAAGMYRRYYLTDAALQMALARCRAQSTFPVPPRGRFAGLAHILPRGNVGRPPCHFLTESARMNTAGSSA